MDAVEREQTKKQIRQFVEASDSLLDILRQPGTLTEYQQSLLRHYIGRLAAQVDALVADQTANSSERWW